MLKRNSPVENKANVNKFLFKVCQTQNSPLVIRLDILLFF